MHNPKRKALDRVTRSCTTNREGALTRRRGHAPSCKKGKASACTSAVMRTPKKGRHRPTLHGHARPTEKRRRPAIAVTHTLAKKGRHQPAEVQSCAIQKEEGINPHYTVLHDQERRGVDPPSWSRTLQQRKEGIGPHYTVMRNQERRGVDPPSRSRTLLQRKEGIDLHKCSQVHSKRGRHWPALHGHAQPTEKSIDPLLRSHTLCKASACSSAIIHNPKGDNINRRSRTRLCKG
ncbi:uncharacterized protein EDB91DRAFT_1084575 [Suillus paluster]|uniref:uncharacterized protein n=1 Tax=Suillus paluster TaxID=48578 RepID=UPI001B87E280|nr:uncharacterized protein EDB91DRAFT_1084575 [Suillus paluster]KAG1733065.1 hypothetical protein EDB91DRAFT_1084575 [Suillus paluster]